MHCYHNLSKEKVAFQSWLDQFNIDQLTNDSWLSVLRQKRLGIINSLLDIFPLMDIDGKRPTLRWTLLPPSDEIRECIRDDTHISVVVGDVAQLVYSISRIFDVPLRYPIRLMGSTSMIQDEVKVCSLMSVQRDPRRLPQGRRVALQAPGSLPPRAPSLILARLCRSTVLLL